jgi:hypothetical protein
MKLVFLEHLLRYSKKRGSGPQLHFFSGAGVGGAVHVSMVIL